MQVTVLGSGTGVPSLERGSPGYLLEASGQLCLIDCGSGTLRQLLRAGKSYLDLHTVFVTHYHPDHIGDLIPLIHALKATPGARRERALILFGPPGFLEYYEHCVTPVATPPKHFPIQVHEAATSFTHLGMSVRTAPTLHSDHLNSIAYRFEDAAKTIVFSGDCDYDRSIISIARGADLMFIDCSFPSALKLQGHLSATECGQIADLAGVRHLVLSHLYPVPAHQDTRLPEARQACSAEVSLATDLMTCRP